MPGRNGGGAAVGGLVVILLLTAMTLNTFSGVWDAMMENKGPVVMVIVGLLIAWFSMRDSSESNGVAGHAGGPSARGRGQLVGSRSQPHPSPPPWLAPAGSSGDGSGTATRQQQEGSRSGGGAGSQALSLQQEGSTSGKLGSPADAPPRRRKVQGNLRSGAVAMVASSAAAGKQGSESGRSALVLANDTSLALATSCTFLCAKPAGCGYRHACPDLGRRWMHCDKHGSHPLPSDGSGWREVAPEREQSGGSLRLCLAWDGTVLDVTALGACRKWDQEMIAAVLNCGRRMSGMCSQSPNFPVLHKWHEVAAMDYKVAARSRRLWSMFERWLSGTNGSSGGSKPLAIEMGRRSS